MPPEEGLAEEDPGRGWLLSRAQALLHIIEQDFVYWGDGPATAALDASAGGPVDRVAGHLPDLRGELTWWLSSWCRRCCAGRCSCPGRHRAAASPPGSARARSRPRACQRPPTPGSAISTSSPGGRAWHGRAAWMLRSAAAAASCSATAT